MQIDTITQPKTGDLCLVQGHPNHSDGKVNAYRVVCVKSVDGDVEIVLNRRLNIWFSWNKYMTGKSWVIDCRVVLP